MPESAQSLRRPTSSARVHTVPSTLNAKASRETLGSIPHIREISRIVEMSTSKKSPATIRHGGPGASHENAKKPLSVEKPASDDDRRRRSKVSGGGGERDSHQTHNPLTKGGKT